MSRCCEATSIRSMRSIWSKSESRVLCRNRFFRFFRFHRFYRQFIDASPSRNQTRACARGSQAPGTQTHQPRRATESDALPCPALQLNPSRRSGLPGLATTHYPRRFAEKHALPCPACRAASRVLPATGQSGIITTMINTAAKGSAGE